MPTVKLTPAFVARAAVEPNAERTIYWDASMPGFGLRVTKDGHKAYVVQYRAGGGRSGTDRRMTLSGVLSTADARKEARVILGRVAKGGDPLAERRKVEASAQNTLRSVCEKFLIREGGAKRDEDGNLTFEKGNGKLRTAAERHATFKRHVYKKLGSKQIDAVKRSDINAILDAIEDESGAAMADHTLAYLRRVFNWHAARSDDFPSPIVRGMARGSAADKRDRILTDDELRAFWRASLSWGHPFSHMLRFVLLTATRRDEAADMVRSEIEGDIWLIPAGRYKTNIDFEVPLSKAAQNVLSSVTKVGKKGFSFTTSGTAPVSNFSNWKKCFDRLMLVELRKIAEECGNQAMLAYIARVEELIVKIAAAKGATKKKLSRELNAIWWVIHDLRRSARSLMTRAHVEPDHAERALGHVIGGSRGVYDRHSYRDEKRAAFEALAKLVERIIDPGADNVASLDERRAARKGVSQVPA